jgi:trigger factor
MLPRPPGPRSAGIRRRPSVYSTVHVEPPSEPPTVKVTSTPADRSTVVLEVEVDAQQLQRAIDEAVRHQSRRIRVPGFRPGKVPRSMLERAMGIHREDPDAPDPIYDDAREHLYQRSVVDAVGEAQIDVLELPAAPEWLSFEEGSGAAYRVIAPIRPKVELGDYTGFPFSPQVDEPDDARVDAVVEQLRDQQASLVPVEDRGVEEGDFAVISFQGRKDGVPVEGAASDRFPLVIGKERMVPGFEVALIGMREDEERTFTVTFPEDYGEAELAGQPVEFTATLRELRERRLPELDDSFAQSMGAFADVASLRTDIRARLHRNALDRARHGFADRIIEYAVANATVTPPDLLVEREVDVMIDELKVRLAQQQIEFEEYLKVTERDEAKLREESREGAEHRVKVLLVLGAVADKEGVDIADSMVQDEIEKTRRSNPEDRRLIEYLESDRGRSYVRSTLRRSQVIERIIDTWIEAHPRFSDVRHTEDQPVPAADQVEAATDALEPLEPDQAGEALEAELAAAGVGGGHAVLDDSDEERQS